MKGSSNVIVGLKSHVAWWNTKVVGSLLASLASAIDFSASSFNRIILSSLNMGEDMQIILEPNRDRVSNEALRVSYTASTPIRDSVSVKRATSSTTQTLRVLPAMPAELEPVKSTNSCLCRN